MPSQPRALDLLLHLSASSPKPFLPHWALFLPPTNTLVSFLAAPDTTTRAKAVTIISNLLSGARQLLRNTPLTQNAHQAFTPTSVRALRAARVLHSVVANALLVETDGIVLAKLAKLAAELFTCMPYPAASEEHIVHLFDALRTRVLSQSRADLTSRAAGTAALAIALGKSGGVIAAIDDVCDEVVTLLGEDEQPVEEFLGVLKNAVTVKEEIFRRVWEANAELLLWFTSEERVAGRALHCVRLIEAFLDKVVRGVEGKAFAEIGDTELEDIRKDLRLGWELYESVLRKVLLDGRQSVQTAALSTMDSLLRLTGFVHDLLVTDVERNEEMYGNCNGGKCDFTNLSEAVALLQEFAQSDCGTGVRIAAIRSLASTPVRCTDGELALSVLCCLDDVLRENDSYLSLRGKALGAVSVYMDRVLTAGVEVLDEMLIIFQGITVFAIDLLRTDVTESLQDASAAIRTNTESSRIAAINVIACSLRHCTKVNAGSDVTGLADDQIAALTMVLTGRDSVNTRCICCKAIDQILRAGGREFEQVAHSQRERQLLQALEGGLMSGTVKLQLVAAQVLKNVPVRGWDTADFLHAIDLYSYAFRECVAVHTLGYEQPDKNKREVMLLQDALSESIYSIMTNAGEEVMKKLGEREKQSEHGSASIADTVVMAVFRYLSIPRHLAGHMTKAQAVVLDSHKERNVRLLLESLPLESRETVYKVLSLWKDEDGSKTVLRSTLDIR